VSTKRHLTVLGGMVSYKGGTADVQVKVFLPASNPGLKSGLEFTKLSITFSGWDSVPEQRVRNSELLHCLLGVRASLIFCRGTSGWRKKSSFLF
jgi:hypothetical protein